MSRSLRFPGVLVLVALTATAARGVEPPLPGENHLVSVAATVESAELGSVLGLSDDGRYVLFGSNSTAVVDPPAPLASSTLYRRDLSTGETRLVSSNDAAYRGAILCASMSPDGRFVAYCRGATNTFFTTYVFLRDMTRSDPEPISVNPSGQLRQGFAAEVTADGRFVLFESGEGDLVAGDSNGALDVFVRDRATSTTRLISGNALGTGTAAGTSTDSTIDRLGTGVAFSSGADDLVAGDLNAVTDVFYHRLDTGVTELVSFAFGGGSGNGPSTRPTLSADGTTVAFLSGASDLAAPDADAETDVFVHRLGSGLLVLASVSADGSTGGNGFSNTPRLSADGGLVLFESDATNLHPIETFGATNVFLRDLGAGVTELISIDETGLLPLGSPTSGLCFSHPCPSRPVLSADGNRIVFESDGPLVTPQGEGCCQRQVYVRDRTLAVTFRASVARNGLSPETGSSDGHLSADGLTVAFNSTAGDLVLPAVDRNGLTDAYARSGVFAAPRPPPIPLGRIGSLLLAAALGGLGLLWLRTVRSV